MLVPGCRTKSYHEDKLINPMKMRQCSNMKIASTIFIVLCFDFVKA